MRRTVMMLSVLLMWMACAPRPLQTLTVAEPEPPAVLAPAVLRLHEFVANNFAYLFVNYTNTEWTGCLFGSRSADTVRVERMELANVDFATQSVAMSRCRLTDDYLGTAHAHPDEPGQCGFSMIDDMGTNPRSVVSVLVCKPDLFIYRFGVGSAVKAVRMRAAFTGDV